MIIYFILFDLLFRNSKGEEIAEFTHSSKDGIWSIIISIIGLLF